MSNEKMIEEMAKEICSLTNTEYCASGRCEKQFDCPVSYRALTTLYKAGYRKLPKNSVVMTEEDYNRLFTRARQGGMKVLDFESIRKAEEKARKETAMEILAELQGYYHQPSDTIIIDIDDFYELAKQYGVEVEE